MLVQAGEEHDRSQCRGCLELALESCEQLSDVQLYCALHDVVIVVAGALALMVVNGVVCDGLSQGLVCSDHLRHVLPLGTGGRPPGRGRTVGLEEVDRTPHSA